MPLDLLILEGPTPNRRLSLGDSPTLFGRSPTATHSFPDDTFLSTRHLLIEPHPNHLLLTDQQSTNGTFLNGERITQAEAHIGDIIRIGALKLQVVAAQTDEPESPIVTTLRAAPGPLYCLLDAAADDDILRLLTEAAPHTPFQCLYDGESATTLDRWAPYLVALPPESRLLPTLVEQGWGKGWATYFISPAPFATLRKHFRQFLMVQVEGGKEVYFRFYDPRVLRDFLPTSLPGELQQFFGPVTQFLLEARPPATLQTLTHANGILKQQLADSQSPPLHPPHRSQ